MKKRLRKKKLKQLLEDCQARSRDLQAFVAFTPWVVTKRTRSHIWAVPLSEFN